MAVNDFTGKNIKDTYPRLVQTDGTNLADGTGSILPLTFEGNNVKISGSLIANEYVVSSSVTNISIATLSGSTTFGDSIDDTHVFNGKITASGNIGLNSTLTDGGVLVGGYKIDDFNALTANSSSQTTLSVGNAVYWDKIKYGRGGQQHQFIGNITASGNVSSSGEIIAASGSFEIIHGGTF